MTANLQLIKRLYRIKNSCTILHGFQHKQKMFLNTFRTFVKFGNKRTHAAFCKAQTRIEKLWDQTSFLRFMFMKEKLSISKVIYKQCREQFKNADRIIELSAVLARHKSISSKLLIVKTSTVYFASKAISGIFFCKKISM